MQAVPSSTPNKRGRPPKPLELSVPSTVSKKAEPSPKVKEPPPAPAEEKPPPAPAKEPTSSKEPNYWRWRRDVEDILRRQIADAIQRISQMKEIEEKGSTKEMREVASKYIELLLKDFVYVIAEKLNSVNQYNTPDDDFPIYEDDDKYYFDDGKTIADLEKNMEISSSVDAYIGYLTSDFDDKDIKISFE